MYSVVFFQFFQCSHRRHNRSGKIVKLYVWNVYSVIV